MALGYASDLMYGVRSPVALFAVAAATCISWTITSVIQRDDYVFLLVMLFGQGFFINSLNNIISSACAEDQVYLLQIRYLILPSFFLEKQYDGR